VAEYRQSHSTVVSGTPEQCFAVLVDFERYPEWSSPVTACRVLDRGEDGLPRRVAFELDMTLKTLRYTLEYRFDPPHGGTWRLVEGDVSDVVGAYRFEPAGDDTRATCEQAIDVGFWIPGFLKRTFEQKALVDSVEEFRRAVEARA
jgi:ribosome-associated toxin RatA of RatAB toxin-antitoxin module